MLRIAFLQLLLLLWRQDLSHLLLRTFHFFTPFALQVSHFIPMCCCSFSLFQLYSVYFCALRIGKFHTLISLLRFHLCDFFRSTICYFSLHSRMFTLFLKGTLCILLFLRECC